MTNITPTSTSSDSSATLTEPQHRKPRQQKLYSLYKDGFSEKIRVPFWHDELKETRHQVSKEWLRTSMLDTFYINRQSLTRC